MRSGPGSSTEHHRPARPLTVPITRSSWSIHLSSPCAYRADFSLQSYSLRTQAPDTLTICGLSPLTNLALAMRQAPDVVPRIRDVGVCSVPISRSATTLRRPSSIATWIRSCRHGAPLELPADHPPLDVTDRMLTTPARLQALPRARICLRRGPRRDAAFPAGFLQLRVFRCRLDDRLRCLRNWCRQWSIGPLHRCVSGTIA